MVEYQTWFEPSVMFWMQTFKEECFKRVARALELDKDVSQVRRNFYELAVCQTDMPYSIELLKYKIQTYLSIF